MFVSGIILKKMYFTKSVTNFEIAFIYILKYVKISSYKVTILICMYDMYIKGGEARRQKLKSHQAVGKRQYTVRDLK